MIHLTKEGPDPTPEEMATRKAVKDRIFGNNIVIHRDFTGVILSPMDFQKFQEIVNERRPWCSEDSVSRPAGVCGDVADFIRRRFGMEH